MKEQLYELLQGAGWLGIIAIAIVIAATIETGKQNRRPGDRQDDET